LESHFPRVDATDRPGLAISWPNTHFPFHNSLFLTEQLTDARVLQDRVQEAAAYMRARSYGGLFVVCLGNLSESAKENLAAILARAKFVQAIPMTGMAGDILPIGAPGHAALRFVRIWDNSTIHAFAELNCVSYGVPIEMSLSLVKEHTLWHEHAFGFVAYEGDKPVSTATAIINEGCLFLFLVATAPDARRKGFGEAVTSCVTCSPRSDGHPTDRAACNRTRIPGISAPRIPPDCEIYGMHAGVLMRVASYEQEAVR